jgi:hypothetical protein
LKHTTGLLLEFIVGSAAIVESMWSEADNLLSNKRRSCMSPMNVEAILFLKKNKDLWNIRDVHKANVMRLKSTQEGRIADDDDIVVERRVKEAEKWAEFMMKEWE